MSPDLLPNPDAAELEALRRDAARYRWLRERGWYIDNAADVLGLIPPRKPWADSPPRPDWDEVEEALDALISGRDDCVSDYA